MSVEEIHELTHGSIPGFSTNCSRLSSWKTNCAQQRDMAEVSDALFRRAKQFGFSDRQLAVLWNVAEMEVRADRLRRKIVATFKSVDTCAAEFEAYTPYYYSTYEDEDEVPPKPAGGKRIVILGGGPNRIGQGIEFDYCCCHASYALRELGIESVMVNSNPETVSTDYDTSDLLFFEPLTVEDVLNICDRVQPDGVIVQFGGQTPLNLARALSSAGVPIIGTSVDTIEDAEDREKFQRLLQRLGLRQPANGIARTMDQARMEATRIGYPNLVRPSFVLGGRAMEICYDQSQLEQFVVDAFVASQGQPVLIDRFLEDAIEVDVDAIGDGQQVIVAGIMEHIEEAGVHSGDSACALPPYSLSGPILQEIRDATCAMAKYMRVVGLMNVQYAIVKQVRNLLGTRLRTGQVCLRYVLEVNPRASRTVPFVAKATGMPVANIAAKVMAGISLGGTRHRKRTDSGLRFGEGKRLSVREVRRRRHCAGTGDAIDRRSDGRERTIFDRLRQKPAGGRRGAADQRQHFHQRRFGGGEGTRCRSGTPTGGDGISRCWPPAARRRNSKRPVCRSRW